MRRAWPLAFLPILFLLVLLYLRPEQAAVRPPTLRPAAPPERKESDVPRPPPSAPPAAAKRLPLRTAFDRLVDALRAKDRAKAKEALEDLRIAFQPEPVPDEENAALIYKVAFERLEAFPESEEDGDLIDRAGGDLTPAERSRLAALLGARSEILQLLRDAAKRPRCDFGVKYTDGLHAELPHISPLIRASKLLRAEAALNGGDPAAAARLAEAVADEPLVIAQLVRGKTHGLAADAMEFTGVVPPLPTPESLRSGMERSLMMELYAGCKLMIDGDPAALEALGAGFVQFRPFDDPQAADDLAYYGESLKLMGDLAGRPYWESREALEALQVDRVQNAPPWVQLSRLMLPSMARASEIMAVAEARIGTATIAGALRAYREARGEYPQTLEALGVPLPADPFTGRPFLYRRDGAGFVVWSVGEDRLDGGGESPQLDPRFRVSR